MRKAKVAAQQRKATARKLKAARKKRQKDARLARRQARSM